MAKDRESIGLTSETQAILTDLLELHWFVDGQDIARFCMAYAIRNGVAAGMTPGTDTRWAAGNFDKTGEIRSLFSAIYPECETPVRLMEHFVNEGIKVVSRRLNAEKIGPAELLE